MSIEVDFEKATSVVSKSLTAMEGQKMLFSEGIYRPEAKFVSLVKNWGEYNNRPEFAANAIFLTSAFIFGDETGRIFKKISDKNKLSKFHWLFEPSYAEIVGHSDITKGCVQFFKPAGYNKIVANEWPYNLALLNNKYGGDIRNLFNSHNGNAADIVKALYLRPRAKTEEKRNAGSFTRYGPKIASLAVQFLNQYGLYDFNNSYGGVPVDFQVVRVLMQTNALILDKPENAYQVTTQASYLLNTICAKYGLNSREISEALWNIGNRGCNQKNHKMCPLNEDCKSLISRKPYDKDGMFDPKDTGR